MPFISICICKPHSKLHNSPHKKNTTMALLSLAKPLCFLAYLCAVFSCFAPPFAAGDDKLSAYQVLQNYGFPVGLLPKGVTGYDLNRETGEFSAYLGKTCRYSVESYKLEYKSTISGVITKDRLANLKGVSVYVLFFWLNIVEVVRDGDELQLSVGIASANFPVHDFLECPQCGCGFDCDDDLDKNRPLVSSY